MTIDEIASHRGLARTTIVGQIERMASQGQELSLEHLLPPPDRLQKIREALDVCGDEYLKPIREYLGPEFEYDELRLARLFLREMVRPE